MIPADRETGLEAKCGCAQCGGHIAFPVELAGSQVPCPHCGQMTELSLALPAPAPEPCGITAAELVAAFGGPIRRTKVSLVYRLSLVLVLFMMVLLPVVYVGLIGAAAYGLYEYATHFAWLLHWTRGGIYFNLFKLLAYLTPLFSGAVLVFFMIKPFFARAAPRAQPLAMNPALEPKLYAFIARVCDLVGAPMPKRIDLTCDLNAAAGFRRGTSSLFGNDLVLTIGLPLVAGLNLRQFAGVVAHEFGHFTQGSGIRLSYVIRHLNFWFARLVYQRDAWDMALEQAANESEDWRIMLVANCARLAVGVTRLVLKLLMFLGHGVSCFLLRQMEYDADSYEIKLAGSETFEATTRRLAELDASMGRAYKEMRTTWNLSRRLPVDFPQYLVVQNSKMPPAARETLQDRLGLHRTGLFDTHPSAGDRIRKARRAGEPGVFHLELPASVLFSHFDIVSRQVTHLHYKEDLGLDFDSTNLRPVESACSPRADRGDTSMTRFQTFACCGEERD